MPASSRTAHAGRLALALCMCGIALLASSDASLRRTSRTPLPDLMLWAWERPTDPRALDPSVGVAVLIQTITITGDEMAIVPRRQPRRVLPHTPLVAVTRIEGADRIPRSLMDDMASAIAQATTLPRVVGAQGDFDASESQRASYRTLPHTLRRRCVVSRSGAGPRVLARVGRNWWCVDESRLEARWHHEPSEVVSFLYPNGEVPYPAFLSAPERSATERERAALVALGHAQGYLADEAIKWARAQPGDPSAAEALAPAVEGGRWSCGRAESSRRAFQTLHRLFPGSEWATRTRYWYRQ